MSANITQEVVAMYSAGAFSALPLAALYAETHFRFFKWWPSLLFKKEPEILFDAPRRLNPEQDLPILLIINDVDRYPITIESICVSASSSGSTRIILECAHADSSILQHRLSKKCAVYLWRIPRDMLNSASVSLNCLLKAKCGSRKIEVLNDNLPGSTKAPLKCTLSEERLPGSTLCALGDIHVHSQYSESHVEFGPPISVIKTMAYAYGLKFCAITDHSYDLACSLDDYLSEDPEMPRWDSLKNDCSYANDNLNDFMVLQGEEVSVRAHDNRIIHLGALGIDAALPGSDDGARTGHTSNTLTIPAAISKIECQNGIAFAAHPGATPGFLPKHLLSRGSWGAHDIPDSILFQSLNSGFFNSWNRAYRLWIQSLLSGKKLPIAGGNDAHGDFNRYRAIKIPFVSIFEMENRHLGFGMTGVYGSNHSEKTLLSALKKGRTFVTTGPYINICASAEETLVGDSVNMKINSITLCYESSNEFGPFELVRIIQGSFEQKIEKIIEDISFSAPTYSGTSRITLDPTLGNGYIRAECGCRNESAEKPPMAFTSPCYITL